MKNEIAVVGVRHKVVLDAYAGAFRAFLPERPLFIVTGATTTFAQRRALRKTLKESGNGILLCTQQSLPSSVNFEYVNRVIIPELHYNNAEIPSIVLGGISLFAWNRVILKAPVRFPLPVSAGLSGKKIPGAVKQSGPLNRLIDEGS